MSVCYLWRKVVRYLSFEWFLSPASPNGGAIVLARSVGVGLELAFAACLLKYWAYPDGTVFSSWTCVSRELLEIGPWLVAAIGGVYAALYARFSSQWSYVANLYNQIKHAEIELELQSNTASQSALEKLAQWKAGYIEDAQDLHLHTKENVAAIIHFWGVEETVAKAFRSWAPGGDERWTLLQKEVQVAYECASKKYKGKSP